MYNQIIEDVDQDGTLRRVQYDKENRPVQLTILKKDNTNCRQFVSYDSPKSIYKEESNGRKLKVVFLPDGEQIHFEEFLGNTQERRYDKNGKMIERISEFLSENFVYNKNKLFLYYNSQGTVTCNPKPIPYSSTPYSPQRFL
jgi:hypothetical protein